jgi:hypothetical protein
MVIEAIVRGADGVAVVPCGVANHGCRFETGAARAAAAVGRARRILGSLGVRPERVACVEPGAPVDAFRDTVERLGPSGLVPWKGAIGPGLDGWIAVLAALSADGGSFPRRHADDPSALRPGRRAGTVFLEGCAPLAASLLEEAIPGGWKADGVAVLRAGGIEAHRLPDERCCGAPLRAAGDADRFVALARWNAARLAETGAERIVTACPACARILGEPYAEVGARISARVQWLPEALVEAGVRIRDRGGARIPSCEGSAGEVEAALWPRMRPAGSSPIHAAGEWLAGGPVRSALDKTTAAAAKRGAVRLHTACPRCAIAAAVGGRRGSWRAGRARVVLAAGVDPEFVEVLR